jgi:hypothetical protein
MGSTISPDESNSTSAQSAVIVLDETVLNATFEKIYAWVSAVNGSVENMTSLALHATNDFSSVLSDVRGALGQVDAVSASSPVVRDSVGGKIHAFVEMVSVLVGSLNDTVLQVNQRILQTHEVLGASLSKNMILLENAREDVYDRLKKIQDELDAIETTQVETTQGVRNSSRARALLESRAAFAQGGSSDRLDQAISRKGGKDTGLKRECHHTCADITLLKAKVDGVSTLVQRLNASVELVLGQVVEDVNVSLRSIVDSCSNNLEKKAPSNLVVASSMRAISAGATSLVDCLDLMVTAREQVLAMTPLFAEPIAALTPLLDNLTQACDVACSGGSVVTDDTVRDHEPLATPSSVGVSDASTA